jgi:hypothetical protein
MQDKVQFKRKWIDLQERIQICGELDIAECGSTQRKGRNEDTNRSGLFLIS